MYKSVQADNIHYVSLKEGEVVDRLIKVLREVRSYPPLLRQNR